MDTLIPSSVSYYFNSCRDRTSMCQRQLVDTERQPVVFVDKQPREEEDATNSVLQTSCKSSAETEAVQRAGVRDL